MPATPASNRWPDDSPPAPGWWRASDGQWYPPSSTPGNSPADWSAPGAPGGPGWSAPGGPGWSAPGAPGWSQPGSQGAPGGYGFRTWGPPPGPQQWGVPAWTQPQPAGNGFSIAGIVLGAVALLFIPPLFGILGLVFGGVGLSKKEKLAPVAMIVSGVGLVLGMILGIIVFSAVQR